ncbi:hypothetical protein MLD38_006174 [Melastoma candidum]|uniref:Uncharacterized protein n=1 Tax=Melastoma candidum TaxID=119954 RepID=A0ACB9RR88_9MYRT|nr:hypothetical protein MLD38_006174 [Melastoma candidum]
MLGRILPRNKQEPRAMPTIDKLNETLEMLEKKENFLCRKAAGEFDKAKEYTRRRKKHDAIRCLKKKKMYERQVEQLVSYQSRIHDQMIMLEGAKATAETVDALRMGAATMKAMHKTTNVDDLDRTVDEINEQTESMKQIQDALSMPSGAMADFDEDELEAELEELEGAESELQHPETTKRTKPVANVGRPAPQPSLAKNVKEDEDEIASLQAEMAL